MGTRCILTVPLLSRTPNYYLDLKTRASKAFHEDQGWLLATFSASRATASLLVWPSIASVVCISQSLVNLPPLISLIWPSVVSIIFMPQRPQSQVTLLSPVAPRSHPAARVMNWVGIFSSVGMCHQHRLLPRRKNGSTLTSQRRGVSAFLITIVQHRRALLN